MTRILRIPIGLFAIVGAFAVAGCASERYVRETTQILSDDVTSLRSDLARFIEGQERGAARRINAVVRQRRQREGIEDEVKERLKGSSDAVSLHQNALAQAQKTIALERARADARAAEREALRKTQEKLESDLVGKLDELANQLNALSSTPSFKERASFFVEYFKRTKKAVDEAEVDKKP